MGEFVNNDKIISISCGKLHSLFINERHELLVCGYNYCGQCGYNQNEDILEEEKEDVDGDQIEYESMSRSPDTINMNHNDNDHGIIWDDSEYDDSEDDWFDSSNLIVFRPTINKYFADLNIKIKSIDCGLFHSVVITDDGRCYSFGSNFFGNLGNGLSTNYGEGISEPYKLDINYKEYTIIDVSCGSNHNLLLTQNNAMHQCSRININKSKDSNNDNNNYPKQTMAFPFILSKAEEFGLSNNSMIEQIICLHDTSLVLIDPYKRRLIHRIKEYL